MHRAAFTLFAFALCAGLNAQARPLTPAEGRYFPFSGNVPVCSDGGVLSRIQDRFRQREASYWKSGLVIENFTLVQESGLRSAGVDLIPRRYCKARAAMNDGKLRQVTYWIGENQGIIGWGWGVEWCIAGLDHHRAFGPNCSAAGP